MKKYITLLSFIVCFAVSNAQQRSNDNNSSATLSVQNDNTIKQANIKGSSPEASAKLRTHQLSQQFGLNGDQQGKIFDMLVDAENNLKVIEESSLNVTQKQERKREVYNYINSQMESILTPEQYRAYFSSLNQGNANREVKSGSKKQ